MDRPDQTGGASAIVAKRVSKRYKLFSDARQMVVHQFGLRDLPLIRRPPIPEFTALEDITFELARGERIGLIGRNGAGKTTLLKLITRSIGPTSGEIEVNGTVQALMQTGIGFHPEFTGRQNIDATLQYFGLHGEQYQAAMDDVISFVELGKYLDQPYNTYSLGMQSRTQFAVATAFKPDILLIDEIMGAGDGYFAAKSADRMKKLIGSGCTMILVSHSGETIEQFCDRVIWLRDGRVYRDGDAQSVLSEYEQEMAIFASAGAGVKAAAVENHGAFALPVSLRTAFVEQHVRAAEPVDHAVAVESFASRRKGTPVRRFNGKPGIKIVDIEMAAANERDEGLRVADSISISVVLRADAPGSYNLRMSLLVYSLSGERIATVRGEQIAAFGPEDETTLTCEIATLLLGVNHYVLSMLVEDADEPEFAESARYDLWSQYASLNYAATNESDPPAIHFDGLVGYNDEPPVRTRLEGMQ